MKKLVVLLTSLLIASSAMAVVDTDPDGIGIYFDVTADTNYVDAVLNTMVDCHLIISNATSTAVAGWECTLIWNDAALPVMGGYTYNGSALNIVTEPEFVVGLGAPIPTADATILVSFTVFVMDAAGTDFVVDAAPEPSTPDNVPLYVDGYDLNNLVLLSNSTGYSALPSPSVTL